MSITDIKRLNQINYQIRKPFLNLIEGIYTQTDRSLDWHVHQLLSRNYYTSNLFQFCCYLVLIREKLAGDAYDRLIVFPQLATVIKNYCRRKNIKTEIIPISSPLRYKLKLISNNFNSLYLRLKWIFQFLRAKDKERIRRIPTLKAIILIDTFLLSNSFSKNGILKDRYYNGLSELLSEDEKKNIFYLPHIEKATTVSRLSKFAGQSKVNQFILKHDLLQITDYLFAFWSPFRIKKLKWEEFEFDDFEIGDLIKSEFYSDLWDTSSFFGILNYCFLRKLKEEKVELKLVINWFENQVIDRGLNYGLKKNFPATYCKGYQGFLISSNYLLHFLTTELEEKFGVIPNEIAVIGNGLEREAKLFNSKIKVSVAPAFRFSKLWDRGQEQEQRGADSYNILVPLSIGFKDSLEVLNLVSRAIQYIQNEKRLCFLVKPHPVLDIVKLKSELLKAGYWSDLFKLVDGDFYAVLEKSDLVIGNGSTTLVESCVFGVPVIIVGSQSGLTQNPIPDSMPKSLWKLCYEHQELANTVDEFIRLSGEEIELIKNIGSRIRKQYFEPVTRKSVEKFLMLEN